MLPNSNQTQRQTVSFGVFEVDLRTGELRKRGVKIKLQEKPFQILAALLVSPGQTVTREELRQKLWPSGTYVDFDRSLNTGLRKLREALEDSADNPRFIETLPKRGYRFIAPVSQPQGSLRSGEKLMLAVLPFENLSGSSEEDYFADGLTEELICELGQLNPKYLGVIARTSAIQYKGTKKLIDEIARELNVQYVLEGSVRRERTRVRIAAQLIEAQGQTHHWSASYDRELGDSLAVQRDVARRVGQALAVELLPERQSKQAVAPAALEAYLRGRFFWGQRSGDALKKAIGYFEQALAIDPTFARAHSGIADCRALLCWFGAVSPREAAQKAMAAALRALELDDSLAEAHSSLALIRYWYEWDWQGAEEEFQRAVSLNPSYASAHQWYAAYLSAMGRTEEAQFELTRARELDPLSLIISMNAADPLFFSRKFDEAIEHLQSLLKQQPRFTPALFNLGRVYLQKGMYQEAITAFERALKYSGNRGAYPSLVFACARAGRTDEARSILNEVLGQEAALLPASPLIAQAYLGLGETEKAFEWLRRGIEERSPWVGFLKADPIYDEVRSDSRFQDLLKLIGLASHDTETTKRAAAS